MALALLVTLQSPLPDAEAAYKKAATGKALVREADRIDFAAKRCSVPALSHLVSENQEAVIKQLIEEGFDPSKMRVPPEQWFPAEQGLESVRKLHAFVTANLNDFKQPNPILRDLKAVDVLLSPRRKRASSSFRPRRAVNPNFHCFSSVRYYVPLPAGHVFPMNKFPDSVAKLVAEGTVPADHIHDPGMIADADLLRVHTSDYLRSVFDGPFNPVTAQKLGLPWSTELATRSRCAVAGTLAAARAAQAHGIAANLAGGTHHAFPDRGEGFCVFNDVAVAIRTLAAEEPYLQAMVVDLDAHQGNGTNFIFAGNANVFTYSVHVGRNYPSKKEPGTLDVELPRWVDGSLYLQELQRTLPPAVDRFEPDIAFYIGGVDVHADDRFGQMRLTTDQMKTRDRWTINLLRGNNIPTVVLFGGGYNKVDGMTTELHCQTIRVAAAAYEDVNA